jgi:Spy/CpxP family protein refolding chaperone
LSLHERALATLTLTAEQKTKITPLTDKFREETRGASLTPKDRREKSQKLLKDVNEVLTPEQQTKLRVEMARINGPLVGAMRELKLTPEQRTKVMPVVQKANEDIAKLNGDTNLKGKKKREKVQSIVKTAVTSIKATGSLTEEQKTKLDAAAAKIGQRKNAANAATAPGAAVGAAK